MSSCATECSNSVINSSVKLDPVYRGDDKFINLTFVDENGDPFDLTGSILTLTIKTKKTDVTPLYQEVQTDGDMTDPVNGNTQFQIDGTETASWTANRSVWFDVLWTNAAGDDYTFMAGTFDVLEPTHTVP